MATKYKGKIVSAQGEGGPVYKFREVQPGEHPAVVYNVVLEGGGDIRNQDKTITENGQYTADAGYTGLGTVTVEVPSVEPTGTISITQNGNYDVAQYANANVNVPTGSIPNYIAPKNNVNGVYKADNTATSFSLNGATDVGLYALYYAFYDCTNLTSADLSSLTTISGGSAMGYCFYGCTGLTSVSFPSLTTISGGYAMTSCFQGCTNLTSVDLSSLTTISGGSAMSSCFYGCTNLTSVSFPSLATVSGSSALYYAFYNCNKLTSVDLSSLTTISGGSAMTSCFQGCTNLTSVDLSSLTTISGGYAMNYCFQNCTNLTSVGLSSLTTVSGGSAMGYCFLGCTKLTELRFPALQSFGTSASTVNQFNYMLSGVTGCTLHFPSNMQSEVESRTGYPNFGGTNTVVLFDLPPTA